jgi:hypothetical protein
MFSDQLFLSKRARAIALGLCTVLLASGAAAPSATAGASTPLPAMIKASLLQAPTDYAAWRGTVTKSDPTTVTFKPTEAMSKACPECIVDDEFALAQANERYVVQFNWLLPKAWSRAQILAFIQLNVGASLPSFTLAQGTDTDGENWFSWTKTTPDEFVYVETGSTKANNGFVVRVGHFVQKNVHYVPFALLTPSDRDDLAKAVTNFVQLGVQDAGDNFTSLRGPSTDKDNNYFPVSVSFGKYLSGCDVNGIFADESASGGTSKWVLECDTPALGGAKSDIEEIIRSTIEAALPGGFTVTTDPKYLMTDDYRWDRSSDALSVDLSSDDKGDGTVDYHIEVYHFTS